MVFSFAEVKMINSFRCVLTENVCEFKTSFTSGESEHSNVNVALGNIVLKPFLFFFTETKMQFFSIRNKV